jgi:serine kinase of HPr protein (carbohydrate metabolism regulator)
MIVRQATCVAIGGRGVVIEGPSGSGKSSLALGLIDRGAALVGDDGISLEAREGRLWALPPPNIAGKLEIRNLGIVDFPATMAPVALVIALDPAAPRHIDRAGTIVIEGHILPLVRLWPDSPALPLRAEWALRLYGG